MTIPDLDMKDKGESGSDIDNNGAISSDLSLSSSSSQDECFRSHQHAENSLRVMETYFLNQQLTDVVLIAGDRRIPAHRLVLSAGSDYFAAMFTSNLREARQNEVELKGVNGDALWTLVRYCYTGLIELVEDTVETLLKTACLLQLNEVIEACCAFLKKQLHPSNCIGMQIFAESHGCSDLQDTSLKFTAEHFMEVVKNMEFLLLPSTELVKLLASDDLNVSSEEDIFHALMSWLEYDLPNRTADVSTLLSYVKLPLLSPSFIVDHIESVTLFRVNPKCRDLIMEAFKYHLLPERRSMLQSPRTYPRKSTLGSLYAVGGLDLNDKDTSIEKYDVRMNEWTHAAYMTTRRLQFGIGVIDGKLYVVGGRDGFKTLKTAECYDLKKKVWKNLPDMSTHRHGLGVATLEGPLYAVGGHDGWSYLNSVERWDPQTKTWSNVASMHTQRSTLGVAVLNGKLYAVGGRDGMNCLNTVECYDPHTNKWILRSPMTKRRGGVSVGVVNGYLYAVGGHEVPPSASSGKSLVCVERYNPRTDTWQVVASMATGREAVGVCCFGERLFVAGGFDVNGCLKLVEAYDPEQDKWYQVAPLIRGRAGLCVIAIKKQ